MPKHSTKIRPKAQLSTPFGRFLERVSYGVIACVSGGTLVLSALYFWLAPEGHGLAGDPVSLADAWFFSVVTFTSLGYGDLLPEGFGRLLASLEVMLGVMLISVFVGKVASERQSALVLLLYTSDHQRRVKEFAQDIRKASIGLSTASVSHDHAELHRRAKEAHKLIAALGQYLIFQAHQGGLVAFGNHSALRNLYRSVHQLQTTAYSIWKVEQTSPDARKMLGRIAERVLFIVDRIEKLHSKEDREIHRAFAAIRTEEERFISWCRALDAGKRTMRHQSGMPESLLQRIAADMPPPPWKKHVHKDVAKRHGITTRLAQSCVSELVRRNTWPKLGAVNLPDADVAPESDEPGDKARGEAAASHTNSDPEGT